MDSEKLDLSSVYDLQKQFFNKGNTRDVASRINSLKKLRSVILDNESIISEALKIDLKKSEFESYATEIGFVLEEIRYHINNLRNWAKPQYSTTPLTNFPATSYTVHEPLGTVLIIAPWNYPFQLLIAPLVGALSAGNTAILKPSELTSATSQVLETIINKNFDPGLIKVIQGDASTTQSLLKLDFDHIFFTGSPRVGKIIMQAAAHKLIPVTLELGGKSPCIVDKDINIKLAAKRIVWGKLVNAGQTCIAPDYFLVNSEIKDQFISELKNSIHKLYGENVYNSDFYPRIINKANIERLSTLIVDTNIVYGGNFNKEELYFEPTIIDDVNFEMPIMQQEIFGPLFPIISVQSIDESIVQINKLPKPLALYLFSNCQKNHKQVLENTSSGGVTINDTIMHIASNKMPFGGVGNSGIGSYHGKYSFDTFSNIKPVVKKNTWLDIPIRYAPYGRLKLKLAKLLLR